ncbi:MAG: hypothetical protein KGQ58_04280 [Proteobacteria bacterium]|nr:hypothetical protein [Pseudomonadota bacterium]
MMNLAPQTILWVGEVYPCKRISSTQYFYADFDLTNITGHFDLVIVAANFVSLPKDKAENIIARLRDWTGGNLWVIHRTEDNLWQLNDFLALGLQQLLSWDECLVGYQLYGFSLSSYKVVPEWLNNDFWAHPERFKSSN